VEELVRARESGLRGGFVVPPICDELPGYHDEHYERLWSAAADLAMPVTVHGGNGVAPDAATTYGSAEPLASILHFTECSFFDRRPLWCFLWGGVFERPKLRLVVAEGLAHWVPQELHRLDEMYDMWNLKMLRDELPLRPSEYWRRHATITASFISRSEAEMRHEISLPNLLWGSDYPHPEGTWPYTDVCLRHALHGVPENEVRAILGENAFAVYDFDRRKLRAIADRIGPLPDALARPPESLPDDYVGMGLRQ
jgi:predicted TIM-barrel fold metal-dependent hydrolase